MKRKIIRIIDEKCTGCGICATSCAEGAIAIIDGKARLINEVFCDGLGACIKECPEGAIIIEEREAKKYDEIQTIKNILKHGINTVKAHLKHLKEHGQEKYYNEAIKYLKKNNIPIDEKEIQLNHSGCPHSKEIEFKKEPKNTEDKNKIQSELTQWPIQLHLINPMASYFKNADIIIAADCTAFSYGDFHRDFLKAKKLIIGCPKLDSDLDTYSDKIKILIEDSNIKTLEVITMEVPCCFGLLEIVNQAVSKSKRKIKIKHTVISIDGKIIE